MKETDIEVLRQIVSRTDKTGNKKVEMLVEFVEQQLKNCNLQSVSVSLPDPALKLAGKMAMAAETVINSKITTVSVAIAMLEDALNEYNNEIFSRQ